MGKIQNQDLSQFDRNQWVEYLKEGAYRGAKINRMATKFMKHGDARLVKDKDQIELTYGTKKITIKLAILLTKQEDWTLSRLIHNFKMALSSDYANDFTDRIEKLAGNLVGNKTLHDFVTKPSGDIKQFFYANQKIINGITGDQQAQDDLLKLAGMTKDPNLAHLIAAKATGAMPLPEGMDFGILPLDVQSLIFAETGPALVSTKLSKDAPSMKNKWINDNHISLKELGCTTAKEAVQYVIDHKLTSANLSAFGDLDDKDLENLSKCTKLKKLSLPSLRFSGDKLVDELKKLDNLESLSLASRTPVNSDQVAAILAKHTNLQQIDLRSLYISNSAVKALVDLPNLQGLTLQACRIITPDQIAEILEKQTNLQSLNLSGLHLSDRVVKAVVNLSDLQEFKLENGMGVAHTQIVEILTKHTHLKDLHLSTGSQELADAIVNLNNLQHLKLTGFYTDAQLEAILKKHTNLQSLTIDYAQANLDKALKAIGDLNQLHYLKMPDIFILGMDGNPSLQVLEITYGKIITFDQINKIIDKFPNLRKLDISNWENLRRYMWVGSTHLSDNDIQRIKKKHPNLKVID